ncbi:MAG: hypothetical protein Q9174_000616 [Haloplaca sp. 1 TL-2023]
MPAPKPALLGPLAANRFRPPRGRKKIYLPNFTLTFLRTPFSPPNYATFITPLSFNKLDLKDYLYNLYSIPCLSIRSYVQQSRVRADKPSARNPKQNRWFRPRAKKRMTIEMPATMPFVWPEAPTDLKAWDKETHEKAMGEQEEEEKRRGYEGKNMPKPDRGSLKEQAEELLRGKKVWRPGWMGWDIHGRAPGSQIGL